MLRRWPIVLLAVIVLGGAGAAFGTTRDVTHTAQSRLTVGPSATSAQALTLVADNSTAIAATYARLGESAEVKADANRALNLPRSDDSSDVTFAPVDRNPVVLVTATAPTSGEAVLVSNAYAQALRRVVAGQINARQENNDQLEAYQDAAEDVIRAKLKVAALKRQRDRDTGGVTQDDVNDAQARLNTFQLRQQTAGDIYARSQQDSQTLTGLGVFDAARPTGDDRRDLLYRWIAVGVAVGLVLGALLALAGALRRRRKILRNA